MTALPKDRIRRLEELEPSDQETLKRAYRRLREAVEACAPFRAMEPQPGEEAQLHDGREMAKVYGEVKKAEAELWSLREELLGWTRPPWAQSAEEVEDWFSPEDAIYDEA